MTRTILATAVLAAATALASNAAQACLSCEYVPEVVRPHATSPLAYGRGDNESSHGSYGSYSAKRRIAKSVDEPRAAKVAKTQKAEKPAKVAKIDRDDKPAKVAKAEPNVDETPKQVAAKPADSESSSITVAAADVTAKATVKAEKATLKTTGDEPAAKQTDCKKFFASVGMTLTVPCE